MIPADITFIAHFPSHHWLFIENIVLDDNAISELEKPWQQWKWENEKVVLIKKNLKRQLISKNRFQKSIDINRFNLPINNKLYWFWKSIEIEIAEEIIYWLSSINKIDNNR